MCPALHSAISIVLELLLLFPLNYGTSLVVQMEDGGLLRSGDERLLVASRVDVETGSSSGVLLGSGSSLPLTERCWRLFGSWQ